jgi:hypothetical protein
MRAPEWNFLCWLVKRKRKMEGGKLSFDNKQDQFQDPQGVPVIAWKSRLQVL